MNPMSTFVKIHNQLTVYKSVWVITCDYKNAMIDTMLLVKGQP